MSATLRELDVRTLPPPRRHPEIFGAFDALAPGESFVLINDHDPKPLLYQFQAERAARFDWSALEAGPRHFRIEIRRRASEAARDVSEYLESDHRRLDAIAGDVAKLVGTAAFEQAGLRFAEFMCGLRRHIDVEEQILFPVFEKATGMATGPTTVMRNEHLEIRQLMDLVAAALLASDRAAADQCLRLLGDVLSNHNMKEEQILYPMTDRAVGGARERDDLVKRMQAF